MASLAFAVSKSIASHKANGGEKVVFGTLTMDTSYPDDGYTKSQLLALAGLSPYISHDITAIFPLGPAISGSGETGSPVGYDTVTETLRAFESAGDGDPLDERPTGDNDLDGATVALMIIGH